MAECAVHPGKHLEVFCFTCNRLVCRQCAVVAHKSPAHDVGELAPMAAKVRAELHELAAAVGLRGPVLRAGLARLEAATAEVDVQERTATAVSVDYFTVLQRAVCAARDQSGRAITAEAAANERR
jgi:tripartite motif-containing protein 45